MVQTYQGYFKEGRFVSPESTEIPECVEVYVVVTSNTIPGTHRDVGHHSQKHEDSDIISTKPESMINSKQKMSTEEALDILSRFRGCIKSEDFDYEKERDEWLDEKYGHID